MGQGGKVWGAREQTRWHPQAVEDMGINMLTEYTGHVVRPGDQWMTGEDLLP